MRALTSPCRKGVLQSLIAVLGLFVATNALADEKFPKELTEFVPYAQNPIFVAAGPGHWDVKIRERGWILREGDQWKMWYTGYDGTRPGKKMLGYATSNDGLVWKRDPRNPIHSQDWVEDVCIIPVDGTYYMFAESEKDRAQLLTSRDGIQWTLVGRIDVRLANGTPIEDGPYGTPAAWYENGTWNLFYERKDLGIWLARSTDLKFFTNVQDDPVITRGPADYDLDMIAVNQIIRYHDRYYAIYHGNKRSTDPELNKMWTTSLATSTDLIHWEKYPHNPLRPLAENKSSGLLIRDGDKFRLYTMHNEVHVHFPRD
jgi:beta-1,2-mannobiose phosphorylase / 1,2-beta-oligomannan phosphorylase